MSLVAERFVPPFKVAAKCDVDPKVVARWAAKGVVLAKRLPGKRGHWRIGVDAEGWPLDAPEAA